MVFYTDISRKGSLSSTVEAGKEYGICEIVRSAIEVVDYMSRHVWKAIVEKLMGKIELKIWWIHAYHDHSFVRQNRVIVRLLLNVNMYLEKVCQYSPS